MRVVLLALSASTSDCVAIIALRVCSLTALLTRIHCCTRTHNGRRSVHRKTIIAEELAGIIDTRVRRTTASVACQLE